MRALVTQRVLLRSDASSGGLAMSTAMRFLGVIAVTGLAAACTNPTDEARMMSPTGGAFNETLYNDYLTLSQRERDEFDFRDSRYFAGKASAAATPTSGSRTAWKSCEIASS